VIKYLDIIWRKDKLAGVFFVSLLVHTQFNNTALEPFVFLIFWGSLSEVLRLKLDI